MSLPQRLNILDLSTTWASQLDPLLANAIVQGIQLTNQVLIVGVNQISHKLGRKYQGYIVTGMHGSYSQIFDTPSQMPILTLILHSSAATSVDIYIY